MFWCIGLSRYTTSRHVSKCHRDFYLQWSSVYLCSTTVGYFFNGVIVYTLVCEQSLFCSKIRGEERKTSERAWLRVWPARLASSHVMLARSRPLAFFAFFPADFRVKERLLAVYLHTISLIVSFYFMKWCQYLLCFSSYSLRSRTSFVLVSRGEAHIFLWHGSKSSEDSRATAKAAAKKMQERFVSGYVSSSLTDNVPWYRIDGCSKARSKRQTPLLAR